MARTAFWSHCYLDISSFRFGRKKCRALVLIGSSSPMVLQMLDDCGQYRSRLLTDLHYTSPKPR
ncbi:hypothetical protein LY76DRAFT_168632 [Colletotrichum caudatum]|nr:hypothetical protein LY76DRAFT_168632 [Colletotrichum caudatum]